MSEALWSLLGVVVGFLLSEGAQWVKAHIERRGLRDAMAAELHSIIRMIPSKLDILNQAEQHFVSARLMPTASTHFPNQVYCRIVASAADLLTPAERDCLHVLHERLRIIDESMDRLEERYNSITSAHSVGQAVSAVSGAIRDLSEGLDLTRSLAQSVLDKNPINVYKLTNDT